MSAGFKVAGEIFWGTNGAVEAYVEALAAEASGRFGAGSPLAVFFRDEQESSFTGALIGLDPVLQDVAGRERFVDVLDAATARLLREDAFTDYGREWLSTVIAALRSKVATSDVIEAGPAA